MENSAYRLGFINTCVSAGMEKSAAELLYKEAGRFDKALQFGAKFFRPITNAANRTGASFKSRSIARNAKSMATAMANGEANAAQLQLDQMARVQNYLRLQAAGAKNQAGYKQMLQRFATQDPSLRMSKDVKGLQKVLANSGLNEQQQMQVINDTLGKMRLGTNGRLKPMAKFEPGVAFNNRMPPAPTVPGGAPAPTVPGGAPAPTVPGGAPAPTVPGGAPAPTVPGGAPAPTVPGGEPTKDPTLIGSLWNFSKAHPKTTLAIGGGVGGYMLGSNNRQS